MVVAFAPQRATRYALAQIPGGWLGDRPEASNDLTRRGSPPVSDVSFPVPFTTCTWVMIR
jgi:hypothetical protein